MWLSAQTRGKAAILGDSVWLQTICTTIFRKLSPKLRKQPKAPFTATRVAWLLPC